MNKIVLIFSFFALFLASCKKDEAVNQSFDYFIFGTAYGECIGNCAQFFKLEENALYGDEFNYYTGSYAFSNTNLDTAKLNRALSLFSQFPNFLEVNTDTTFGCPDCHDQGGIHLEIKKNGVVHFWHIDTDKDDIPSEIHSFSDSLIAIVNELSIN